MSDIPVFISHVDAEIIKANLSLKDGSCKGLSDFEDDFDALNKLSPNPPSTPLKQLDPHTENLPIVRTYAQVDGALPGPPCNVSGPLLQAASEKGFKVVIGLWYVSVGKAITFLAMISLRQWC